MTRSQALRQLDAIVRTLNPKVRAVVLRALRQAKNNINVEALVAALRQGHVDTAVELSMAGVTPAMSAVRAVLAEAYTQAGQYWMRLQVPEILRLTFSVGLPEAAKRLETLNLDFFPQVLKDLELGFRKGIATGLELGQNPRVTAIEVREFTGLTEYDWKIVRSFQRQLTDDPSRALGRLLRDRRFDRSITKGNLSDAQIRDMVDAYQRRLLNWRAETWSRTATLKAARESNLATWADVAASGPVPRERFVKTWVTRLDGRERPTHHAANGLRVGLHELFPVNGGQETPGDNEYNCRCSMLVSILPAPPHR